MSQPVVEQNGENKESRLKNLLLTAGIHVGIPLYVGSTTMVMTKISELTGRVFIDNLDLPTRSVGVWTGLGTAALLAFGSAKLKPEQKVKQKIESDLSATQVMPLDICTDKAIVCDVESEIDDDTKDRIWRGIVERLSDIDSEE